MVQTGILPPELKSVDQLFSGDTTFSVPKYQRSFAWGEDEIEELWDDVIATIDRKGDYFLGTLVLQGKDPKEVEIIDGQQRIACISMIFSAIRNVYLASADQRADQLFLDYLGAKDYSKDAVPHPKFVMNRINNDTYLRYVITSSNKAEVERALKQKGLDQSNKLLLRAYSFFLGQVISEASRLGTDADKFITPLINYLRARVKFITIPVTTDEDANLFFESLNARGKELAVSDLVKNRLYFEAGNEVTRAQELWEKIENDLISRSIPEYIRHYWIAKKTDLKNLNVREKRLYRAIASEVSGKPQTTIQLLADLALSASDYVRINDYNLWPDDSAYGQDLKNSLDELALFKVFQCHPLLLNAIQGFKRANDVAKVFRIIANFSFRYFIIGNQSPGNLERETGRIAYSIRTGEISKPKDIADTLRSINSDQVFRSDFALVTIQKTRAKIARYILSKISNYIASKSTGAELVSNPDAHKVNLEHVLPQEPGEVWKKGFSKDIDPADYIYRLGNLTLLTTKINSELANTSFADKKPALSESTLPINQYFKSLSTWDAVEIEKRQDYLAKLALEVWDL
ncbi:MAG: hypothetical protein FD146_2804 [Anaerolineaceae bacterium]|nr:MAG: hypothetical protein FD146_2804 [Anaerolineaceae bacterium]